MSPKCPCLRIEDTISRLVEVFRLHTLFSMLLWLGKYWAHFVAASDFTDGEQRSREDNASLGHPGQPLLNKG